MKRIATTLLTTLAFAAAVAPASAQIAITSHGVPVTQDFNTLANTGTSSTTPAGWTFAETGTSANTTYSAGTGSSTTGDTYSFGAVGSGERSFGGLQSGALVPTIGASFINQTGTTIGALAISYMGEQWRIGTNNPPRADRIDFQYSLNATSLTTGTWSDVDPLDFTSPNQQPNPPQPVGALDGNAAANRALVSGGIASLSISNGATFWIRWTDFNATGADDGLSVDDFSLTSSGQPTANDKKTWGKVKAGYR